MTLFGHSFLLCRYSQSLLLSTIPISELISRTKVSQFSLCLVCTSFLCNPGITEFLDCIFINECQAEFEAIDLLCQLDMICCACRCLVHSASCPYPFGRHADALGYAALLAKNLNTKALMRLVFFSPKAFVSSLSIRNL